MQGRQDRAGLMKLARRNLILVALAIGLFSLLALVRGTMPPWGAAYTFGTPVTVELPSSCEIVTIIGNGSASSGTGTCDGTTWWVDGESHTGTLYAFASDIDRSSTGELEFTGEARAFGDWVYGRPQTFEVVLNLTLPTAAGIGVLALIGSGVAAVLPARPRRPNPPAPEPARVQIPPELQQFVQQGLLRPPPEPPAPISGGTWVFIAEIALIALAAGAFTAVSGQL